MSGPKHPLLCKQINSLQPVILLKKQSGKRTSSVLESHLFHRLSENTAVFMAFLWAVTAVMTLSDDTQ